MRETLDLAARLQGVGHKYAEMQELLKREKEMGITPDPLIDAMMKARMQLCACRVWVPVGQQAVELGRLRIRVHTGLPRPGLALQALCTS